jgi:hypothetical protein
MRKTALIVVVVAPALMLTGCKSSNKARTTLLKSQVSAAVTAASTAPAPASSTPASTTPTVLPPPAPASSASPTPTPSTAGSPSTTGSASPTNVDPCQAVTQDEASTLAKATFGAGQEETTDGGGKICVYGSQTTNVFTVEVAQASSGAAASAEWTAEVSEAEAKINSALPPGVHVNFDTSNVSGIGDMAATLTGTETLLGKPINFTGIYVLSGPTFFLIGDLVLGQASPAVSDMEDQARTTLGRVT